MNVKYNNKLNINQRRRHLIIWLIIVVYLNVTYPVNGPWQAKILSGILESVNYAIVYYSFLIYIIPKFWISKRFPPLFIASILCYLLYVGISYLNYIHLIAMLGGYSFHLDEPLLYLFFDGIYYCFMVGSAAIASFYHRYSIHEYRLQSKREKTFVQKELNFLKNQFNSHITFNFLNYCFSKIHLILPNIAEAINYYSNYLRFTIRTNSNESILIKDELNLIKYFISLQKKLFPELAITFSISNLSDNQMIRPFIINVFLEDMFRENCEVNNLRKIKISFDNAEDRINLNAEFVYYSETNIEQKGLSSHLEETLNLYYEDYDYKSNNGRFYISKKLYINLRSEKLSTNFYGINNNISLDNEPNPLTRLNKYQTLRHILFWGLLMTHGAIVATLSVSFPKCLLSYSLIYLIYMLVFYTIRLYIFPKYWDRANSKLILLIGFLFLFYFIAAYSNFKFILPSIGHYSDVIKQPLDYFIKFLIYGFAFYSSAGIFSFFSRYGVYKVRQQEEKAKLLLSKELFYLRSQFNSPLTFSFLNYCKNEIAPHSPETAQSIGIFSDMLSYTLNTPPDEKVPVNREINYINDFISIQKLLTDKVYVNFKYSGDFGNQLILTRILVTFVENAFKHGTYNKPESPINISLDIKERDLWFEVTNKINPGKKISSTSKGIENVSQILGIYYSDKYSLEKSSSDGIFSIKLWMLLD